MYMFQKPNHSIIMVNYTLQKKNACCNEQQYQVKVKPKSMGISVVM